MPLIGNTNGYQENHMHTEPGDFKRGINPSPARKQRRPTDPAEFVRLGLFLRSNFLDAQECAGLCSEMASAASVAAAVSRAGISSVNEQIRRTQVVQMSADSTHYVRERLKILMPDLATHFSEKLSSYQEPQFLLYRPGAFFEPHSDNSGDPRQPERIRRRNVSAVLFLNSGSDTPSTESGQGLLESRGFGGGRLNFYYLTPRPTWEDFCLSLVGTPGLLVAFRSNVIHQVTPVTDGTRFTVVTWFE